MRIVQNVNEKPEELTGEKPDVTIIKITKIEVVESFCCCC
jgi:hypothetical protein